MVYHTHKQDMDEFVNIASFRTASIEKNEEDAFWSFIENGYHDDIAELEKIDQTVLKSYRKSRKILIREMVASIYNNKTQHNVLKYDATTTVFGQKHNNIIPVFAAMAIDAGRSAYYYCMSSNAKGTDFIFNKTPNVEYIDRISFSHVNKEINKQCRVGVKKTLDSLMKNESDELKSIMEEVPISTGTSGIVQWMAIMSMAKKSLAGGSSADSLREKMKHVAKNAPKKTDDMSISSKSVTEIIRLANGVREKE